mmetsp:Transcript_45649/g.138707  ORF Transcript_45649/g.138707 Transcript_45649/m.138707 type:complete len:205 (-) Transcript_45649:938-1552(-)
MFLFLDACLQLRLQCKWIHLLLAIPFYPGLSLVPGYIWRTPFLMPKPCFRLLPALCLHCHHFLSRMPRVQLGQSFARRAHVAFPLQYPSRPHPPKRRAEWHWRSRSRRSSGRTARIALQFPPPPPQWSRCPRAHGAGQVHGGKTRGHHNQLRATNPTRPVGGRAGTTPVQPPRRAWVRIARGRRRRHRTLPCWHWKRRRQWRIC